MIVGAALAQIREVLTPTVTRGMVRNIDPESAVTSSTIAVSGRVYWTRLREGGRISAVQFAVVTASGNLCIAVARNVGSGRTAKPGEVLASTGSFVCPGSGTTNVTNGANGDHEQALNTSVRVKAGDWIGVAADNTSVALRCTTASSAADSALAEGCAYRETISSGSPVIPTSRAALTGQIGKNWLLLCA